MPRVKTNGVELYYEETGNSRDPAMLLIMGLGTQMIAWPEPLIEGLAARGLRVIAFDNRDIGLSTHMTGAPTPHPLFALGALRFGLPFKPPYTLPDMATDAVGLLDALAIEKAHLVGASMGGMIAQLIASGWPDRTLSLTSIMSSSGARGLPGPTPELSRRLIAKRPANITRAEAVKAGADMLKLIAYPDALREVDAFEAMAGRAFDRARNPDGHRRQLLAALADGSRVERLKRIAAPTLVIHGRADKLVPLACGESSARAIPGARLEVIDAMAHDLPPSQVPRLVDLIAGLAETATDIARDEVLRV